MKVTPLSPGPKAPETVLKELQGVVADAEKLLGATLAECAGESTASVALRSAALQQRLASLYGGTRGSVRAGIKRADKVVRTHPYEAVAMALGIGALLGVLFRRNGEGRLPAAESEPPKP